MGQNSDLGAGKESASPSFDPDERAERARWRIYFWLIFLLTPVATTLFGWGGSRMLASLPSFLTRSLNGPMIETLGVMLTPILGALGAGFCLTRLHAKPRTTLGLVVYTVAFGAGMLVVYAAIAFVGCLIAIS